MICCTAKWEKRKKELLIGRLEIISKKISYNLQYSLNLTIFPKVQRKETIRLFIHGFNIYCMHIIYWEYFRYQRYSRLKSEQFSAFWRVHLEEKI